MLKKLLFILAIFILNINIAQAGDIFSSPSSMKEASAQMPQFRNITCKFRQEKLLPDQKTILKSSGDFEFLKDKSITFKTTSPVQSVTSYSPDDYMFAAFSSKNSSYLEKTFDIFFEKNSDLWTLGLKPKKNSKPAKGLNSIVVEGKVDITKIIIDTKNSGKTTIYFE